LGVDPGSRCAGWAVVGGTSHHPLLIASGEIVLPERRPFAERLCLLHEEILVVVERHAPTEAAVESPFHGASARSALQLAHARGAILAALGKASVPVFEYSPATVKKAVTGNGRAEKGQVQTMINRLVQGDVAVGRPDVADAVAAALCHLFGVGVSDALVKAGLDRPRR
jgi:crossover junction endodeoxyribonuclease RuvC